MTHRARTFSAALALCALGLTVVGCTNTEAESTPNVVSEAGIGAGAREKAMQVQADPSVEALVPKDIADAGTFSAMVDPSYAPMEYTDDSGKIIGMEPDLVLAIARKMGVEAEFVKGSFDGQIAAVQSKRADLVLASASVVPERLEAVSMVSYMNGGTSVMVKQGNAHEIATTTDLCGKTVATMASTTQVWTTLPALKEACAAAGMETVTELILPQQDTVNQAVTTGRAEAMLADNVLTTYFAQVQPDQFESVDSILVDTAPIGFMINKSETEFSQAVEAAINSLIEDGTYGEILKAWGLEASESAKAEAHF